MALNIISGNWSSRHLVSCRARTSTSLRSNQAATRSARLRIELTFQVARRMGVELKDRAGTAALQGPGPSLRARGQGGPFSDLDGDLALGGHAGAQPLAALHEPRRLGVETGEEQGQLLAGLLALGAEVRALEDLPGAQDRADDLVVVQPQVVDAGLGDDRRVLAEVR